MRAEDLKDRSDESSSPCTTSAMRFEKKEDGRVVRLTESGQEVPVPEYLPRRRQGSTNVCAMKEMSGKAPGMGESSSSSSSDYPEYPEAEEVKGTNTMKDRPYFKKMKTALTPLGHPPSRAVLEWETAVHTYEDAVKWHLKWTPWFNKDMIEAVVKYGYLGK